MIVYNTTFMVSDEVEQEFLAWIRAEYLPHALADGMVSNPVFLRIMGSTHDGGTSYALQLHSESVGVLQKWCLSTGKELSDKVAKKFGSMVAGFTTMMNQLDL